MKILIIGSKGFIGSHILNYFQKLGNEVYACDVVVDYTSENYFQIDASNSDYHHIFQKIAFDVCVNCSGAASVPQSLENPFRDFTLNTVNVVKILDAIREFRPDCKFINLSSAAVYGNPKELPIKESSQCAPISPYGNHKLFAEVLCEEYTTLFGIKTCSARIFSAYGNGLRKQLIWDLYQKFSKDDDTVNLFGTGEETRDFIHIDDICTAINCIIERAEFRAEKINIANGKEIKIKSIAETFSNLLTSDKTVVFSNQVKEGDPKNWKADIQVLQNLGYQKTIDLENGLKKFIIWARELK
ncbi:MAG: NAD-dependent epimerase/dehydratase family protein [Flavobacteriales bacterium]